ncbi:hypothetical protein EDEG_00160 [Edhazardia aedis USNM 41457]|uniref:J domain-containing protein n=1 Tax=Edhazardia aedis (strain USNM 41457) TaxID=1003232 RepID=J9D924_EDHAE|nr:hypothetical protein EDEG_00160 [Edhazardia aedis USNM 41457]|eukprot:EJW04004.1 hypothetical protein EDEG_00160 [Edhazardia aedis USNM 41457]
MILLVKYLNMVNYYQRLGLKPTANNDQIERSYIMLINKLKTFYHDDQTFNSYNLGMQMYRAFQILSNKTLRHLYDNYGEFGLDIFTFTNLQNNKGVKKRIHSSDQLNLSKISLFSIPICLYFLPIILTLKRIGFIDISYTLITSSFLLIILPAILVLLRMKLALDLRKIDYKARISTIFNFWFPLLALQISIAIIISLKADNIIKNQVIIKSTHLFILFQIILFEHKMLAGYTLSFFDIFKNIWGLATTCSAVISAILAFKYKFGMYSKAILCLTPILSIVMGLDVPLNRLERLLYVCISALFLYISSLNNVILQSFFLLIILSVPVVRLSKTIRKVRTFALLLFEYDKYHNHKNESNNLKIK